MNKTLALHIEQDYIIAGIEPFQGKFSKITKRGDFKFPLYFFVNNIDKKIDYSFQYKYDYEDGKKQYIGDFINQITDSTKTYKWYDYDSELINLFTYILDDIKDGYYHILSSADESVEINKTEKIETFVSFSDNFPNKSIDKLKRHLESEGFKIKPEKICFPKLFVNHYLVKNSIRIEKQKYLLIEALGKNLNISIINAYNEYDIERSDFETYENYGIDPRIRVIAKKIVDDINKHEGILNDTNLINSEYIRHQSKAEKIVAAIEKKKGRIPKYLNIETTFIKEANRKFRTRLSLNEIDELTSLHVKQIARFVSDNYLGKKSLNLENIDKIFLIGNTLNNDLIKNEFERFGKSRLEYVNSDEIYVVLKQLLSSGNKPKKDTQKPEKLKHTKKSKTFEEIKILSIGTLNKNQKIKLLNNDPAPGKGDSMQLLRYLGNNKFVILASTRSLASGDIATVVSPTWIAGIQIDFQIERNGKIIGQFKTRRIVKIMVQ